jgi:hypothetical protein
VARARSAAGERIGDVVAVEVDLERLAADLRTVHLLGVGHGADRLARELLVHGLHGRTSR